MSEACRETSHPFEVSTLRETDFFKSLKLSLSSMICFFGAVNPKLLHFQITDEQTAKDLYVATIISREEKMTWQSFQDLLAHAIRLAEAGLRGFFGLDILNLDIQSGLRHFNPQDFSCLLINHAKTLAPETPKALIRYGQLFAVFHQRAPGDWGKIDLATYVEILNSEKTSRESFFKKMLRQTAAQSEALCRIHDIGSQPVWPDAAPGSVGNAEKVVVFHSKKVLK